MEGFDPLSSQAYRLFRTEFETHIGHAELCCASRDTLSAANLDALSRSFHTLKGSAGFFGFTQIAESSSTLELVFRKPLNEVLAAHENIKFHLRTIMEEFANLPEPREI